jgi:hypothetical protein
MRTKMIRREHEILFDIGDRHLIYPLDTTFIRDLDSNLARKWIEAGWDVDKTILIEVNSLTIPGNQPVTDFPSKLLAGLIYAWSEDAYYRVVVFSKGFFDDQNEILLRINVWHEKQHITNFEDHLHHGSRILTEDDVVKKEVQYVLKTFGETGFRARRHEVLVFKEKFENSEAIPGSYVMLFLREYFGRHSQKYAHNSFSIPHTEHSRNLRQAYGEEALNLIRIYDVLDENVPTIFKYTLQDMGL